MGKDVIMVEHESGNAVSSSKVVLSLGTIGMKNVNIYFLGDRNASISHGDTHIHRLSSSSSFLLLRAMST